MKGADRELIALDWKTGEVVSDSRLWRMDFNTISTQVLKWSSDDNAIGGSISNITVVRFLEGPWLLALCYNGDDPQLLIFNTLLPQQDSRSWRILGLPSLPAPQYCTQYEKVSTEYPEFSVDPAQRLLVVVPPNRRALTTPMELLVRRMHSVCASPYIPWDEWAEDFTEISLHPTAHTLQVFDMKVLVLCGSERRRGDWGVQMFDLSKWGQRDIQVRQVNEGVGGVCRRILSTPKWFARCQMGNGIPHRTLFVGNKVVCFFVSPRHVQKCPWFIQCRAFQHWPSNPNRPYFLRVWTIG